MVMVGNKVYFTLLYPRLQVVTVFKVENKTLINKKGDKIFLKRCVAAAAKEDWPI